MLVKLVILVPMARVVLAEQEAMPEQLEILEAQVMLAMPVNMQDQVAVVVDPLVILVKR
jgi:hypothetical protein